LKFFSIARIAAFNTTDLFSLSDEIIFECILSILRVSDILYAARVCKRLRDICHAFLPARWLSYAQFHAGCKITVPNNTNDVSVLLQNPIRSLRFAVEASVESLSGTDDLLVGKCLDDENGDQLFFLMSMTTLKIPGSVPLFRGCPKVSLRSEQYACLARYGCFVFSVSLGFAVNGNFPSALAIFSVHSPEKSCLVLQDGSVANNVFKLCPTAVLPLGDSGGDQSPALVTPVYKFDSETYAIFEEYLHQDIQVFHGGRYVVGQEASAAFDLETFTVIKLGNNRSISWNPFDKYSALSLEALSLEYTDDERLLSYEDQSSLGSIQKGIYYGTSMRPKGNLLCVPLSFVADRVHVSRAFGLYRWKESRNGIDGADFLDMKNGTWVDGVTVKRLPSPAFESRFLSPIEPRRALVASPHFMMHDSSLHLVKVDVVCGLTKKDPRRAVWSISARMLSAHRAVTVSYLAPDAACVRPLVIGLNRKVVCCSWNVKVDKNQHKGLMLATYMLP